MNIIDIANPQNVAASITPTGNAILFHNKRNNTGTIVVPENSKGDFHSVVLAIGPEVKTIAVGDKVLTTTDGLVQLPWSGEPLFVCPETSVVAKLNF